MMKNVFYSSLVAAALGFGGGWLVFSKVGSPGQSHDEHGEEAHGHAGPEASLSPQALRNLGIEVKEAEAGTFSKYVSIPAVVMELPTGIRPLFSPVDGRVMEIRAWPGALVPAGEVLVTILRDSEEFLQATYALRRASRSAALLATQLPGGETPLDLLNVRTGLRRLGVTDAQIKELETGISDALEGRIFQAIADFLQKGKEISDADLMKRMRDAGVIVDLSAPTAPGVSDWDIRQIDVKWGERLEAGTRVLTLANPRQMLLKTEPVGAEAKVMLDALARGLPVEAVPLVEGEGPHLKNLRISYIVSDSDTHGTDGFILVSNEPFKLCDVESLGSCRTWLLRGGQRFMVRIPSETMSNVFVLPAGAVTDDGPDKVVFIQDGESFRPTKVVVLYQDHEVVVLDSEHSELFPGDSVVQRGAFGLGLALKAGSGAVDPHAGHNH